MNCLLKLMLINLGINDVNRYYIFRNFNVRLGLNSQRKLYLNIYLRVGSNVVVVVKL